MAGSKKRIMVDMSCTLIHHGHITLLKKASDFGDVVVGLTSDEEIIKKKGYKPELSWHQRYKILMNLSCVYNVVEVPWNITDEVLDQYCIDMLVHGDDDENNISSPKIIFPRTEGISSSDMRYKALDAIVQSRNNAKPTYTPGPSCAMTEWSEAFRPIFGRGDDEYQFKRSEVINYLKGITRKDTVTELQGSSTLAIEIACRNFIAPLKKVLVLNHRDFYAGRIAKFINLDCDITYATSDDFLGFDDDNISKYDWITLAHVETSIAKKYDLNAICEKAHKLNIKVLVDATASINLEEDLECCDVCCFSSCKGLMGMTGGAFIAYNNYVKIHPVDSFYLDINTHINHLITGPYHAMLSLYGLLPKYIEIIDRIISNKLRFLEQYPHDTCYEPKYEPVLCTLIDREFEIPSGSVGYQSRAAKEGESIVCHLDVSQQG